MVKIVNPLGDVKVGKQGEAVYQRKYGQQIRRTVSPKRAIVSEAQEKHRRLYRDALDWRKALSLANRRFLEGYCISNWVVDGFKIPLPWHRFALKLYLERVNFVPSLVTTELVGEEAVDQEYTTGDADEFRCSDSEWTVQTFTPALTAQITKVKLKLSRNALFADFIIKIITTDGDGYPTDTVLCSKTFSSEPITEVIAGDWYEFSFDEPATLIKETVYGILIHGVPGLPNPKVYWREDGSAPQYFRGCSYWSGIAGVSWTRYLYDDLMFQTFMLQPGETITYGTLAITHPALLRVVHKRGEQLVKGYDNLSSLDDERLTRQAKLEVEGGDVIEATTVADICYKYLVK
ncbi:hypothetical protein ES703_61588 [subsurface metagenome]